ncbi:uncharacterized protein isoform X2 [Leptinotarsa decemlineata]|uniref:uncharacterized protein isoform X2 n=1 Tax=Leptinotarsa decemlineata TaxID=7539 RepID=UPI003D305557
MEKTWTVVGFEDESVEAVPTSWIIGDQCYWPTQKYSSVKNMIINNENVNTCWPLHKIKVFRNATCDNYLSARAKTKLAEETSDLQSEKENKRKRINKICSSSDDDETPQLSETRINLSPPPRYKKKKMSKTPLYQQKSSDDEPQHSQTLFNVSPAPSYKKILKTPKKRAETVVFTTPISSVGGSQSRAEAVCNQTCNKCCTRKDDRLILQTILTQTNVIKHMTSDVLLEMQQLKRNVRAVPEQSESLYDKLVDVKFPINDQETLDRFNNHLNSSSVYTLAMPQNKQP